MAQVSGNKVTTIQASKNLGTVINTQVSGDKSNGSVGYKKITNVKPTQVSGLNKTTNYMGVNDEGIDIRKAKKIDEKALATNQYESKAAIFKNATDRLNGVTESKESEEDEVPGPGGSGE